MMDKIVINRFRTMALQAAAANRDPWEWVIGIFGMVPPEMHAKVFGIANAPDWFAQIFGTDPEAQKHLKFLTDIRGHVLEIAMATFSLEAVKEGQAPEAWAKQFGAWVSPDFLPSVRELAEAHSA